MTSLTFPQYLLRIIMTTFSVTAIEANIVLNGIELAAYQMAAANGDAAEKIANKWTELQLDTKPIPTDDIGKLRHFQLIFTFHTILKSVPAETIATADCETRRIVTRIRAIVDNVSEYVAIH